MRTTLHADTASTPTSEKARSAVAQRPGLTRRESQPLDSAARAVRDQRDGDKGQSIQRGEWVRVTLDDGSTRTCRFVSAGVRRVLGSHRWWHVDHGAYGSERHDTYLRESAIVSAEPAQRPALLLTFVDPFGQVRRVGRYASAVEAEAAMRHRPYATEVRIEAVRRSAKPRERSAARAAAELVISNARGGRHV